MGAWLRTQREARGVSVQEIAQASKISLRYLEAIESDRFDTLPAPVFVRGFLREYARVVGLDPDEVVNLYLAAESTAPQARDDGRRAAAAAPRAERSPLLGYALLVGALLVVFLGIAAAISFWSGRGGAGPAAPPPAPLATPEREPSGAAKQPTPHAAGAAAEAPSPRPDAGADAARPLAPAPPAPAASAPAPADPPSGPLRVVLEFHQDCWVEAVVDGRRRASELKAGGETLALEAREEILLTLGNAPAVRLEVDGRSVALPMQGSRVVRELRIDRTGISPVAVAAAESET